MLNNDAFYSVASTVIPTSTTEPGYEQGVTLRAAATRQADRCASTSSSRQRIRADPLPASTWAGRHEVPGPFFIGSNDHGHHPPLAVEHEALPRIGRIEFVTVRLPFLHPFGTSVHVWTCKEALLLRLEADGVAAWGECVADPDPVLPPRDDDDRPAHHRRGSCCHCSSRACPSAKLLTKFRAVRGHGMAKATVENALIDLLALRRGVPVHELLGFPAKPIMSGLSIGLKDSPAELVAAVAGRGGQAAITA